MKCDGVELSEEAIESGGYVLQFVSQSHVCPIPCHKTRTRGGQQPIRNVASENSMRIGGVWGKKITDEVALVAGASVVPEHMHIGPDQGEVTPHQGAVAVREVQATLHKESSIRKSNNNLPLRDISHGIIDNKVVRGTS